MPSLGTRIEPSTVCLYRRCAYAFVLYTYPHSNLIRRVLLISPFYLEGKWNTKRLRNLRGSHLGDANTMAEKEEALLRGRNITFYKRLYLICLLTGSVGCFRNHRCSQSASWVLIYHNLCLFTLSQWLLSKKFINTIANLIPQTKPNKR